MYCNNCGKKIDSNHSFCSNCGKPVSKNNQTPISNQNYNNKAIYDESSCQVLSAIGFISFIVAIITFLICVFRPFVPLFFVSLTAYLAQIISSIILKVKYPHYKYSDGLLIMAILLTIALVIIIILIINFIGSCLRDLSSCSG